MHTLHWVFSEGDSIEEAQKEAVKTLNEYLNVVFDYYTDDVDDWGDDLGPLNGKEDHDEFVDRVNKIRVWQCKMARSMFLEALNPGYKLIHDLGKMPAGGYSFSFEEVPIINPMDSGPPKKVWMPEPLKSALSVQEIEKLDKRRMDLLLMALGKVKGDYHQDSRFLNAIDNHARAELPNTFENFAETYWLIPYTIHG